MGWIVNWEKNNFMLPKTQIFRPFMYRYKNQGIPGELVIGIDWEMTQYQWLVLNTLCDLTYNHQKLAKTNNLAY